MRIHASRTAGPAISLQRSCACGGSGGACTSCDDKKKKGLQRSAVGSASSHEIPSSVHDVLRSPGQPLGSEARSFFEPRFQHDFSTVRVHADNLASRSASDTAARAWTVGDHIAFADGAYAPGSHRGRELLAHELTHVVQQSGGRGGAAGISDPSSAPETEADRVARHMASGGSAEGVSPAEPTVAPQGESSA